MHSGEGVWECRAQLAGEAKVIERETVLSAPSQGLGRTHGEFRSKKKWTRVAK